MSKFRDYRDALRDNISKRYNQLEGDDKIKKLKLTEDFIDEFAEAYFYGETFDLADRELIKLEGQSVYNEFIEKLGFL